jgi:hypothetical protein
MQEAKNCFGMELHKEKRALDKEIGTEVSNHQLTAKRLKN